MLIKTNIMQARLMSIIYQSTKFEKGKKIKVNRTLPILFNTEMVQAILEGRKTVTRRVVKFLPGENPRWLGYKRDGLDLYNGGNEPCNKKPPYQVGDILYVRETWCQEYRRYWYKADKFCITCQ
ncbi:MAG: hypothetical protein NC123_18290 [Butyrivibrio sp.]|nr:hypothetical protein [Acetatifactor muris]MCM1561462.1 hypothetical protein [Butyrivibrio sp.]